MSPRPLVPSTLIASLALATLAACGGGKDPDAGKGGAAAPGGGTAPAGKVTLNASGATFQQAFQEVAIEAFTKANPQVTINYGAGGSGKGRQDFADGVVDFACTDAPYKEADLAKVKGGPFVYVPNLLGPITVSYRLDGVSKLQLSAPVIAKIFQREITTWNDPAIAADNPGVALPATKITVARRSDGSGTTQNFTAYLAAAAPSEWKLASGSTVAWPADTQAGAGNGGVAQIVKATAGAIGYVDLSDAKASGLTFAAIKNQSGAYVAPTVEAATAAGAGIEVKDDLLFSALDARGAGAYPITAQSWCLAYTQPRDAAKGAALKAYLRYLLTDGQALLPEIDFAPLPPALRDRALAQVDKLP